MNKTYIMPLFCSAVLCISANAYADHPTIGFGSEVAGPIITVPASTMPTPAMGGFTQWVSDTRRCTG
jgi:hypothetical protein